MDTQTGQIFESDAEVKEAIAKGRVQEKDVVQLPPEIAGELQGLNRQGRRAWWKQNRKKLNLPRWSERNKAEY